MAWTLEWPRDSRRMCYRQLGPMLILCVFYGLHSASGATALDVSADMFLRFPYARQSMFLRFSPLQLGFFPLDFRAAIFSGVVNNFFVRSR